MDSPKDTMPVTISSTSDDALAAVAHSPNRYMRWKRPFLVHGVGPLILMLVCPSLLLLLWLCNTQLDGSLLALLELPLFTVLSTLWLQVGAGSPTAWALVLGYMGLQLLLMRILPGKLVNGATTPSGYAPQYRDNGLLCFTVTLALFIVAQYAELFDPALVVLHFGEILGALNMTSLILCILLFIKANHSNEGEEEERRNGGLLFDFYWGRELHPRLLDWDVKQFTNCRFGMSSWCLINLCFAATQIEQQGYLCDSMLVSVALQTLYLIKFHLWESGYLRSLDMMHDRAGFYICWGCMVWVPGFYTLPAQYLLYHPRDLGLQLSSVLLFVGIACILINYDADRQRKLARDSGGQCVLWGSPARCIEAAFKDENGKLHASLLLTSGWWGCARHFHYIPEVGAALSWSLPAGWKHGMPYLYVLFLTLLLVERAYRDDVRCRQKYGLYWDQYCKQVKFLILPGVW